MISLDDFRCKLKISFLRHSSRAPCSRGERAGDSTSIEDLETVRSLGPITETSISSGSMSRSSVNEPSFRRPRLASLAVSTPSSLSLRFNFAVSS
jgi:hypothetical protein